jgi:molybdopterin synthase sulfur carrier subunit
MVVVEFLGPIKKDNIQIDISNIKELGEILKQDEQLKIWLDNSAVAVNDMLIQNKDFSLKHGDKISLLPPVCGG